MIISRIQVQVQGYRSSIGSLALKIKGSAGASDHLVFRIIDQDEIISGSIVTVIVLCCDRYNHRIVSGFVRYGCLDLGRDIFVRSGWTSVNFGNNCFTVCYIYTVAVVVVRDGVIGSFSRKQSVDSYIIGFHFVAVCVR